MKPLESLSVVSRASSYGTASRPSSFCKATLSCSRRGKLLLADDDPVVRDALHDLLVEEGYFVIPAENGYQAVDFANNFLVGLVLLDLSMPGKSGWETFQEISREHPLLPIIIATGRPNQLFTALSAGAAALFDKPLDIPVLLATIEEILHESVDQRLKRWTGKEPHFRHQSAAAVPRKMPKARREM